MTHNTNKNLTRLHSLLLAFFGDETLHFHSIRLSNFFNAAFADAEFDDEETETYTPNIARLLHCQNNLQRLLDAAHLLHQHFPHQVTPYRPCVFKQLQHIYPLLNDWDDFPSHLHPHEWCNPETVLEEFFRFQPIDDWKNAISGLLESSLGEGSPYTTMSEKQIGFIVLLLHRLQDAVWLLYVTGRIPAAEEAGTNEAVEVSNEDSMTGGGTIQGFFFIVSNGKFARIDHDKIVCLAAIDDHVQLHTLTQIHKPAVSIQQMNALLPEERFIWIRKQTAAA
ncbi:hypothetical protein LZZ85_21940 [Terrimonas sp. NA20]|uniref:Uncharacterized protein n=1 Tax=Terrimonas ginsenosidimutans TaxID=2908004 RepID=A0ABS9KXL9_9BACT|nr:hypothetical protein [Terrimonas ginsenosidimutans]MCG2616974.1 hypothetical protein [Terrimonas ginsenosidimutans]